MAGAQNVPISPVAAHPVSARHSDTSWVMVLLMVIVAVASIAGIVWAVMHGHNDWAIAVGIVGSAFFTRAAC